MSDTLAVIAARKLAQQLALPHSRGSVYAWNDRGQDRIVVRADRLWLRNHRDLPRSFMGFPVEADEPSDPVAYG